MIRDDRRVADYVMEFVAWAEKLANGESTGLYVQWDGPTDNLELLLAELFDANAGPAAD